MAMLDIKDPTGGYGSARDRSPKVHGRAQC